MLEKLFVSLRDDKDSYLNAKEGKEFEDRIMHQLKGKLGFNRVHKDLIQKAHWKSIKHHISDKLSSEFMDLPDPELRQSFLYQPYGTQQFPDLIIFTNKKVVPIEIKFSTKRQTSPMWNGHVPKASSFYIFGSYGMRDLTFFCGNDVIESNHREALYNFFKEIKASEDKIRKNIPKLDKTNRGFTPYVRSAFGQKNHHDQVHMSFFSHPDRKKVEDLAIERIQTL